MKREPPVDEALARLTAYVERANARASTRSRRACGCAKTSSLPWGAYAAFAVWRTGAIAVLAGANLFKFGPLLGELLADGAEELSPDRKLGDGECGRRESNPHGLSATST